MASLSGVAFVLVTGLLWLGVISLARWLIPSTSRRFAVAYPWYISTTTNRFNAIVWQLGRRHKRALLAWFRAGVPAACACLLVGLFLLLQSAIGALRGAPAGGAAASRAPAVALVPLIPGLTMPATHALFVLAALFLSACAHEAGHSLCAAAHNVRTTEAGVYVSFLAPLAFVRLDGVESQSAPAQLRIHTAGSCHNLACAGLAWAAALCLPLLLWPFYAPAGTGPVALSVHPGSALAGHLHPGDVVTSLNDCPVPSAAAWRSCLLHAAVPPPLCLPPGALAAALGRGAACCEPGYDGPFQCFRPISPPRAGGVPAPPVGRRALAAAAAPGAQAGICLRGPDFREEAPCGESGGLPAPCPGGGTCGEAQVPAGQLLAILALLPGPNGSAGAAVPPRRVAFVGSPDQLLAAVEVGDYRPPSFFLLRLLDLPSLLDRFFRYLFSVSLALAFLNMVPCPGLDGAPAVKLLAELAASRRPAGPRSLIDVGGSHDGPLAVGPFARAASRLCNALGVALLAANGLALLLGAAR